MDKGLGSITWWGFSPALNLLEHYQLMKGDNNPDRINVLIVGSGDVRHILKTVAQKRRFLGNSSKILMHFYVLENNLELYARALLLMALALESPEKMGLQEKTELFAEIFGNTLVRDHTINYLHHISDDFVRMVTDFDYLNTRLPLFDLELLKYKERDMLEGIFKLWRKPDPKIFDIEQYWDMRVRQHLGTRYDSAKGAFDWDYSMKLSDRGAEIIGGKLYQRWRNSGVAFELREGTYIVPNKTLASGMIFNVDGERVGRRGYWGDIVVSPYIAFGIECDDEKYLKRANKEYVSNSELITEYNLTSLLHELQTGERYFQTEHPSKPEELPTIGEEADEKPLEQASLSIEQPTKSDPIFLPCDDVKITFLPICAVSDLASKQKYKRLFDIVYFSNSMVHHMVPPVQDLLSDQSLVILESAKFITEINKDQYVQFAEKICAMAKEVGCQPLVDCNAEKDCFMFHSFKRVK